ncbi:MAG TPA: MinD/ParA family protein [bacterium]|nr:MinD/ParA family protein [bacterium]
MADQADKLRVLAAGLKEAKASAGAPSKAPKAPAPATAPAYGAPPRARVITVASGKGGVGKTNMAVNLALQLSLLGRRVILFDADLGLANADLLMGLQPRWNLTHFFDGGRSLEEILCEGPLGLRLIASGSGIARLADLGTQERDRVLTHFGLLEDQADYLIVDTGAGISQNVLAFAHAAEEVLVVTTPEPTARLDAYGLIKVLAQEAYPGRLRVIVNMAETKAEGDDVARLLETLAGRFLNIQVQTLGVVPRDREVPRAVRAQRPFSLEKPDSPASRAVAEMASSLCNVRLAAPPKGLRGFLEHFGGMLRPKV